MVPLQHWLKDKLSTALKIPFYCSFYVPREWIFRVVSGDYPPSKCVRNQHSLFRKFHAYQQIIRYRVIQTHISTIFISESIRNRSLINSVLTFGTDFTLLVSSCENRRMMFLLSQQWCNSSRPYEIAIVYWLAESVAGRWATCENQFTKRFTFICSFGLLADIGVTHVVSAW